MILFDTTVLMYTVGGNHPLRTPCRRLFDAQAAGTIQAATTVEVVQEFVHAFSRRRPRTVACEIGRRYMDSIELLPVAEDDLELGLTHFERYPRLGSFDCVLAAVAVNRHAEALVSADRAFADVKGMRWLAPGNPALERMLAGRGREL